MSNSVNDHELSSEGNEVASCFHDRKQALWRDIVDTSGLQEKVIADAAKMTPSYFSKVSSGQQGDMLGMVIVIGETFPHLRRAFIIGLADIEGSDPMVYAAEQLAIAALRFMRVHGAAFPKRMARASLPDSVTQDRRRA